VRSRHLLCLGLWSVLATFGWNPTPVDAQPAGGTTTTTTTQTTVETAVPEPAPVAEPAPAAEPAPTAPSPAQTAQAAPPAAEASINLTQNLEPEDSGQRRPMWFFGGQYRHHWVPTGIQEIFMDQAPNIKGPGYGVLASRRNVDGFSLTFGLAYTDYGFEGFFREKGDDLGETEYVKSDMSLWHVTSSFMWSTEFLGVLAFEYGFGLDLGLVFGDINRTEAYLDQSAGWRPCTAAGDPVNLTDDGVPYCDQPQEMGATTDPSDKKGAHYNVDVGKISGGGSIPDIFLVPAIPQLAIRFQPIRNVALRLEAGYGIVQFWVGASLLVGFETGEVPHTAPPPPPPPQQRVARSEVIERRVEVTAPPVVAPPPPTQGRIRGMAWSEAEQRPVAGAVVKLIGMELSSLVSGDDGSFVTYELDPGLVTFELTHADYETATCAATIPSTGGEAQARCMLVPKPKKGAVNGSVMGARNAPLAGVQIQLTGPAPLTAVTDAGGTFSLEGVTPGTYAIRAEAEGYLVKLDQVVVVADITAQPRLVLTEKPRNSVVDVRENEIVITRQINFVTNSAKIRPDAEPILIEVADVMLRHPHIRRVEVQGHTDNKGRAARNLELSQQRAESVRDWLIGAGVEASRLDARGYGQNEPIEDNRTAAGRTKNRRVQFMIREQAPREQ